MFNYIRLNLDKRGNGYYYCRYSIPEKGLIRQSLKTKDRKIADKRMIELENEINSINPTLDQINKRLTYAEFVEEYITNHIYHLKTENKKITTQRSRILKEYLGKMFINAISKDDIREVLFKVKKRRKKELNNKTVNGYRMLLLGQFNRAIKEGYLKYNPVKDVEPLKVNDRSIEFKYFKANEIERLLAACRKYLPHFYYQLLMFIYTGIRKGELCGLKWEDIDFSIDLIYIKRSFNESTKSYKTRSMPMHQELREQLLIYKERCSNDNYVFPGRDGYMNKGNFRKTFSLILRKANIVRKHGIHDLRHTFATQYLENGGSIYTLKEYLGHSDIKTTEKYLHLSNTYMKSEIEKLPIYNQQISL